MSPRDPKSKRRKIGDPQSKRPKIELPSRAHKINRENFDATLPEQIVDDIYELIRTGVIKKVLPSEQTLEESYGVSRMTVRGATKILREAGIIKPRQGLGTSIVGKPPRRPYGRSPGHGPPSTTQRRSQPPQGPETTQS